MNWKFAFRALAAELRRRADGVAPENNAMVKCGAVKPETADAQAAVYRWLADDLEYLTHECTPGREALSRIRRWANENEDARDITSPNKAERSRGLP